MHIPHIPADVPNSAAQEYLKNYAAITKDSGRLMLFACDQKIEHLNNDFYGTNIAPDALNPEHLFTIARDGINGAFATHFGLAARYGRKYPTLNYIIKLNGKTDCIPTSEQDPFSAQLWTVEQALALKTNAHINVCGVGYTLYLGSEFESQMLQDAANVIYQAHQAGLIAILWIYPRGKYIKDDIAPHLVAGAAGIAASLGADFVKLKAPHNVDDLAIAVKAAGNTQVICSGGQSKEPALFLQELYNQIHNGQAAGSATGRNIFQKPLPEAIAFTKAIGAIVLYNQKVESALSLYNARS